MSREPIPSVPPRIPDIPHPTQLQTFGGENAKPVSAGFASSRIEISPANNTGFNVYSNIPIPPIPGLIPDRRGNFADPGGRTDSMTHRDRYSYASSAISTVNSPRRMRRRKDPTPFKYVWRALLSVVGKPPLNSDSSILVIGECNSGKTSFINFLRTSLALPARKQRPKLQDDIFNGANRTSAGAFSGFSSHYVETEIEGDRIGLTLWDSQGLEPNLVDLQLREMASFLESKFEETFSEEMKVYRAPGVRDSLIHCAFFILDPIRLDANIKAAAKSHGTTYHGGIANGNFTAGPRSNFSLGLADNFELEVLRALQGKTTVVPVIAKADTITSAHMAYLKRAVWTSLKSSKLDHLEAIGLEDFDLGRAVDQFGLHERGANRAYAAPARSGYNPSRPDSPTDSESSPSRSEFSPTKPFRPINTASSPTFSGMASASSESPLLPFSIISPDMFEPGIVGRKFPWGFADPFNPEHCDFPRLQETVLTDWREELKDASRNLWYEQWRTARLNGTVHDTVPDTVPDNDLVGWAR